MRRADTVVYLDVPTPIVLWGLLQRRLRYRGGQHSDGTYDRITFDFLKFVTTFRRQRRPHLLALLAEHATHADVVILRSRQAASRWLASLTAVRR